jgi:GNAT superfamily N-acetyltransferase
MSVEQGNADDLSCIARWLKSECEQEGWGLWNSWEGIYKRATEGKLLVYRVAGEPIGFYAYCGKGLGYLSIREDYRRQGIGRALVNKAKEIVFASGAEAYVVETIVGGSDRPFWSALGFTVPDGFERTLVMAIGAPS